MRIVSLWTFILIVVLETPLCLHCLLIPLLNPLMGFDWLLFLLVCLFSYLPLSGFSVRNITLRIWVWYHFSSMVSFYSVFLNLKQCLLKSVWTLLTFLTQIGTCKSSSRQKNGFLFTKNLDFKRICEGTNCSLDAQSNQGCKL